MRDDALPGKPLAFAAGAIALLVALAIAAVFGLLHHRRMPGGGVPIARPATLPRGEPALQTAPQEDLAAYQSAQARALARTDATHVPIAAAMERLVAASEAQP